MKNNDRESSLWDRYYSDRSQANRNLLIEYHLPAVKNVAWKMSQKLTANVTTDDLYSHGVLGLMRAVEKFDRSKGFQFASYANHRIMGSILDEIRTDDWVPRLTRTTAKALDNARMEAIEKLGRIPDDLELAEHLGVSMEELRGLIKESTDAKMISMSSRSRDNREDDFDCQAYALETSIIDKDQPDPLARVQDEDFVRILRKYLNKRDRAIIDLYYWKGKTQKEIGEKFGVCEGRICQVLRRLKKTLKGCLREYFESGGTRNALSKVKCAI